MGTRSGVRSFWTRVPLMVGRLGCVARLISGSAKVAHLEKQRDRFPVGDPRRKPSEGALPVLRREISRCWRKYEARNNDLGHLAANILLVLSTAFNCQLIAGESLKSMKSAGRGRGAKGRWRNWRNNSQVRGDLWRILRYKCF